MSNKSIFTDRNSASFIDNVTKVFGIILLILIVIEAISFFYISIKI